MKILSLNLQSPSVKRVQNQLLYFSEVDSDILILSEIKYGRSFDELTHGLKLIGYSILHSENADSRDYITLIASKYQKIKFSRLDISYKESRSCLVDIYFELGCITILGLYMPSYHPKHSPKEKYENKLKFQGTIEQLIEQYYEGPSTRLLVVGDLNLMEPNHQPPYPDFSIWTSFYTFLQDKYMLDAYTESNPNTIDHSWFSNNDKQRIDHSFIDGRLKYSLKSCYYDQVTRENKLSDHSAMVLELF